MKLPEFDVTSKIHSRMAAYAMQQLPGEMSPTAAWAWLLNEASPAVFQGAVAHSLGHK